MTIRHLNVFIKVCELGSVSKAAEELCVAQPSVSQTIKELESYYKVVLFDRVNKHLVLTHEGQILLQEAKDVIREFEEFENIALNRDLNPTVKIGATITFGNFVIPKFNKEIKEKYPNADPLFIVDKPAEIECRLLHGDLDFAFIEGAITSKLLKSQKIGNDELIAICASSSSIPEKLSLVDLTKYDLFVREKGNPARRVLDYQLGTKGYKLHEPRVEAVCNSVILSMAIEGQGIGILPAATARRWLKEGVIRKIELDTPLNRNLYLVWHKNKTFNRTSSNLFEIAKHILEKK